MFSRNTFLLMVCVICLSIIGCVTAIDPSLPQPDLPILTLATDVPLVASPAHPNANLMASPVVAGSSVTLLGATKDMNWLLVQHERVIGWIPAFFVRDNIGTLTPPFTFTPPSDQCTTYLDATFAPEEPWISSVDGAVRLVGAIYRPAAQAQFTDSTLRVVINGAGEARAGDYVHTALTSNTSLVLFTYDLAGLQKGSQVFFTLENAANESVIFEAAVFADSCAETEHFTGQLLIGMPRGVSGQATALPAVELVTTPTPTSVSTGIVSHSDARTPTVTPTITPFPTLDVVTYGAVIQIAEVTASSSYVMGNRNATSAIDNNIETYWSSNFDDDIGAWLELQLPLTTTVAGMYIYTPGPRGGL
ncbi:MAG: SH3 domain-containing protein, partial [Caldilineaceae bacterium]|nr:SH3 domain-containing protein [Caldilineaceae bacterium]